MESAVESIKKEIEALRAEYEKRIRELETQVEKLQAELVRGGAEAAAPPPPAAPPVQTIPGALNPAISVIGNFLARADSQKVFNEDGDRIDNKLSLREGELDMRVPVDPFADGVLIASFEAETPGRFSVDLEEAYVNIKKLPFLEQSPLGLKLKVGRFRPEFGKNNILHRHDLPQSFRPLVTEEFMGEDGLIQNGVSGNFFVPTPWDKQSAMDATLQVLNGGDLAISPEQRARIAYLGHLRWFRTFRNAHNLELGWSSYYHPRGNDVRSADFHGVDFMYRWKPARMGEWRSFLVGSELMFTRRPYPEAGEPVEVARALPEDLEPGRGRPVGFTIFGQTQFNRRMYAGVRWDRTTTLVDPGLVRRSITPYFSYYFSEFLRFRLNYEHRRSDFATENRRNSVFAELNWVFGSHPPEPFWVNK